MNFITLTLTTDNTSIDLNFDHVVSVVQRGDFTELRVNGVREGKNGDQSWWDNPVYFVKETRVEIWTALATTPAKVLRAPPKEAFKLALAEAAKTSPKKKKKGT